MTAFNWFVILATISTLAFAWAVYLLQNFKSQNEKTKIEEEEEKLVELIGKVRIFVDSKLEQLDKKMEETRSLIKELNEMYISLSALLVKAPSEETNQPTENPSLVNQIYKPAYQNIEVGSLDASNVNSIKELDKKAKNVKSEDEQLYESYKMTEELVEEKKENIIFDMYLSGIEPVEIAKRMKMGVGEVQLIIDLMKRQKT
ncbi:MAG: hypothetical protein WHS64_01365 [Fervidobacterium sp.]|uniref:Uncharacterized protein n=1 Tax=Fervidobacterium gondwanense DSM 13020 TaxID=1121883 RepID=A0A1M7RZF5_FERGO|nr:hypothetical protein [Fervidobacterium gondwanense]UXF00141.1 hypothetical protein IB67_00645 [Fervidobacterium riparium]SHN51514.1 hypothetical protein SAMN02745226_00356 [Fervidobacterium gondwanense DSM 13020]